MIKADDLVGKGLYSFGPLAECRQLVDNFLDGRHQSMRIIISTVTLGPTKASQTLLRQAHLPFLIPTLTLLALAVLALAVNMSLDGSLGLEMLSLSSDASIHKPTVDKDVGFVVPPVLPQNLHFPSAPPLLGVK